MRYLVGDLEPLSTSAVDGALLYQIANRLRCSPWLDLAQSAPPKYPSSSAAHHDGGGGGGSTRLPKHDD